MTVPVEARPEPIDRAPRSWPERFEPGLALGRRLASTYEHLSDALCEDDPEPAIVSRLAAVLQAEASTYGPDLMVRHSSVREPAAVARSVIEGRPRSPQSRFTAEWGIQATPIGRAESGQGWLVVCRRRGWSQSSRDLVRMVVGSAAPLIAAVRRIDRIERDKLAIHRRDLIDELTGRRAGGGRASDDLLFARAAAAGIERKVPTRVVVIRAPGPEPHRLLEGVEGALAVAGVNCLLAVGVDDLVGLTQGPRPAIEAALTGLAERSPGVAAGIGREVGDLPLAPESRRDALTALDQILRDGGRPVLAFEDLDVSGLIAAESAAGRVGPRLRSLVDDLKSDPLAYEALVAFLENEQNVSAAAKSLFLHPNSLRYRLDKAEAIVGGSLKNPAIIATLYVAITNATQAATPG